MSEDRVRTAKKMIKQGRFDHAKEILEELDDPEARDLLGQLDTLKAQSGGFSVSTPVLLIIGSAALLIVAIVVALSGVLEEEDQFDDRYAEWDKLHIELVRYCTPILGNDEIGCLDWANFLLGNTFADEFGPYFTVVQECLGPDAESLETPELAATFGECIQAAEVPEPGTVGGDEEGG